MYYGKLNSGTFWFEQESNWPTFNPLRKMFLAAFASETHFHSLNEFCPSNWSDSQQEVKGQPPSDTPLCSANKAPLLCREEKQVTPTPVF